MQVSSPNFAIFAEVTQHIMSIFKIIIAICAIFTLAEGSAQNITIEWKAESAQLVTRGGYARIKRVGNRHAMVYGAGTASWIRFSDDGCESWSEASEVARGEGYNYTNSELLQLQSGRLLAMWNARPRRDTGLPYKIMCATSDDGGATWSKGQDVYVAGNEPRVGCWEPIALQMPSGEVHIYFANEAPYTRSAEQEISLIRSFDEGKSWSNAERVSFRAGKRDGMAVPIYLPHSGEIAMAIEDNGIRGRFKPVIVRTRKNWKDGFVAGDDDRREEALAARCSVDDGIYAGAPYLIRLGEKHTLLSIQSTEGREGRGHKFANMQVYVGNRDARKFCNRTTPMPHLNEDGSALWNSLAQIDDNRVIAVMTVRGMGKGKNGIWTTIGEIKKRR